MANKTKEQTFHMYRFMYTSLSVCMIFGALAFILGLCFGLSGWYSGYTLSFLGFLFVLVLLPFYLVYRTRFNKIRLAVHLLKRYKSQ